jgi:hypothetical protein
MGICSPGLEIAQQRRVDPLCFQFHPRYVIKPDPLKEKIRIRPLPV